MREKGTIRRHSEATAWGCSGDTRSLELPYVHFDEQSKKHLWRKSGWRLWFPPIFLCDSVRCLVRASQMLGFMHKLETEWHILVFGFAIDCHTLQAIVAPQQQERSSEVPLQKSFVQTQLLPRKLTATGTLGVRRWSWKAERLLECTLLSCVQMRSASFYLKDLSVPDSSELDLQDRVAQLCAALLSSAWNCSGLVSIHFSIYVVYS